MTRPLEDRFWEKVDRGDDDECWEWQAATQSNGYGIFNVDGEKQYAHRVAFRLEHGDPDDNVLHTCHNKQCVNSNHLYDGDQSDNLADAMEETGGWGNNLPKKLSKDDVQEIRMKLEEGVSQASIAREYDVDSSLVSRINSGQRW